MITINSHGIEVKGHEGTWYTIDTQIINGVGYYLMEHEEHGDEAACVIIDKHGALVLDDVYNGFDDLSEYISFIIHEVETEADRREFDSNEYKLIAAYEGAVGIPFNEQVVYWVGDYNMHVPKYEATIEQLHERLIHALLAVGMTYNEYQQTELPKGYTANISDYIVERMGALDESIVKHRLFVDMDGTLAEFKKVDQLETLYEFGYFANLEPQQNVVDAVKEIINNHPELEVYILSAHLSDSPYALIEKNQWLDQHLPEIDSAHRIFPPCGQDKKDFIPGGIRQTDTLLDDYTHNLTLWEPPARGIKLLNGINHTKGTWKGDRISFDNSPAELSESLVAVIRGQVKMLDAPPVQAALKEEIFRIAADLIQEGTQQTESGNWTVPLNKIENFFGVQNSPDNDFGEELMNVLSDAEEVADITMTSEGGVSINFFLDYCQNFKKDFSYYILQLNENEDNLNRRFISLDELQRRGESPDVQNYKLVYSGEIEASVTLENIYQKFNIDHPHDFTGHSLSVSDIVVIENDNGITAHYVDSYGFKVIPGFDRQIEEHGFQPDEELEL